MDTPPDAVTSIVGFLLQLGLPGIVIMALAYAYNKKDNRVDALHDMILDQSKETTKAMSDLSSSIQANSSTLLGLKDIIISRNMGGGKAE